MCDRLCVCVCDGFSRCCSISCSVIINKRQRCSGVAQGHAAALMMWRWRPHLNVKTRVARFPRRPQTAHAGCRLHPRGSRLMDWLSDGSTYCFLSQHTHTRREMDAVRGLSWLNSLSGSLCDLCAAHFSRNRQHKAISSCKQQADRPPTWPHVTEVRVCPSIRKRSKVSLAFC